MRSQGEWLRKLTLLNPAINSKLGLGNKRFAPHKPLLLLCVLVNKEGLTVITCGSHLT